MEALRSSTSQPLRKVRRWLAGWCLAVLGCPLSALAGQPPQDTQPPVDLTARSLEELMDIEVVSVSKRSERISAAAAAVFVITQEDLRRSGATSIADALRMVPGL